MNQRILPYDRYYVNPSRKINGIREQLVQLLRITWDGDLISKEHRDECVRLGWAAQTNGGFNIITKAGIEYLNAEKIILP